MHVHLVVSVRLFEKLQTARRLCAWDSPGKNTRVGCHALLQGIFLTQRLNPSPRVSGIAGGFFTTEPLGKPPKLQCINTIKHDDTKMILCVFRIHNIFTVYKRPKQIIKEYYCIFG